MRVLISLSLLFCGCDLLAKRYINCQDTDICDPRVSTPFVIGQPDEFTNNNNAGLSSPTAVAITKDGQLVVADRGTSRLLVWNTFPTRNYQRADYAIGSVNYSLTGSTLPGVGGISVRENKLISAANIANAASLFIWDPFPTQHVAPTASWTSATSPSAQSFRSIGGPLLVGARYYHADEFYHRILVWDSLPTAVANASAIIGQATDTSVTPNGISGGNPSEISLSAPLGSPATDGTQFLVADSGNHRVLLWGSLPTSSGTPAQRVLGQSSFTVGAPNRGMAMPDANTLKTPAAVAVAGGHIAVADSGNHRVLLWNGAISQDGAPADVILGQAAKSAMNPNSGGLSAARMNNPRGVATDGTRLVVADTGNQRVLIWNNWPSQTGAPAELILGQRDETSTAASALVTSNTTFAGPTTSQFTGEPLGPAAVAGSRDGFYVVDSSSHRVLVYATPPLGPAERPIAVLGQPDFESHFPNQRDPAMGSGSRSASTLSAPSSVAVSGTTLAVADTENNRVLIWRSLPRQNQQPADVILGQAQPNSGNVNSGGTTVGLYAPKGVYLAGGKVYVADTGNHRVLIWNSIPTSNQQTPNVVLGQADLMGTTANRCLAPSCNAASNGLNRPTAVAVSDKAIYVCDSGNQRVLVWKATSPSIDPAATQVLGRPSLTENNPLPVVDTDQRLYSPTSLALYQGWLLVVDPGAHRIVYFDTQRSQNGVPPSGVLGQPDLFSVDPNVGGLSGMRFYTPRGVFANEAGVYVAEFGNNRVVALPPLPAN